jgi:mutator protein MutT
MKQFSRTNVAGIILNQQGELLMAQRAYTKKLAPGIWHLPGGKVEDDEDFEIALIRELQEEFQLSQKPISSIEQTKFQFEYLVETDWHRTIIFIVKLNGTFKPVLDFETEQTVFVLPGIAMELLGKEDRLYNQQKTVFKNLRLL